jgi:hypothetical protein
MEVVIADHVGFMKESSRCSVEWRISMDRQSIRFAAITLISLLCSSSVVRAECPTFTLEQKFKESAAVFVGRVIGMKTVREPKSLEEPKSLISFAVDDLWKEPEKKLHVGKIDIRLQTIATCGRVIDGVVRCLDLQFELNRRFVVFADKDGMSMCAPTARVDQAARTLWAHRSESDPFTARKVIHLGV